MSLNCSIITPSYNMLNYLQLCHASIADQKEISFEHIVIDGGSKDGTVEWLKEQKDIVWISEKDHGMYDAINKGLKLATGEILAYINCDEQYLRGTLNIVKDYFDKNPTVDIIFGDSLIVNNLGELISFRKGYTPRYAYIISSHLYLLSCSMFFRRRIIEKGIFFDTKLKDVGDAAFVLNILKDRYIAKHVGKYLAVFTWTGKNMSTGVNALKEKLELINSAPTKIRLLTKIINVIRIIEKLFSGAYFNKGQLNYSIYVLDQKSERKNFSSIKLNYRWPK